MKKLLLALAAVFLLTLGPAVGAAAAPTSSLQLVTNTRVAAGKVILVVTVKNGGDVAEEVRIETIYGDKVVTVEAGKSVSAAFTSRMTSIPGGAVYAYHDAEVTKLEYPAYGAPAPVPST